MSLPVLHPEKVLGTRGPRGVWSGLSIYPMGKFLKKKIHIACPRYWSVSNEYVYGIAEELLKSYISQKNTYSFSKSFIEKATPLQRDLKRAAFKFIVDDNKFFSGCFFTDNLNCCYFNLQKIKDERRIGLTTIHVVHDRDDKMYLQSCFISVDADGRAGIEVDSLAGYSEHETDEYNTVFSLIMMLVGHRADPTIIPHVFKPSRVVDRHPDETTPLNIEKYSIKITYVTPATFKDRTYRILNSGVKGHVRKQKVGPGRLSVKEVFVKEHERKYSNERTKP